MRIRCKNCGNTADGVDVSSHLTACLVKAFAAAAVAYFTKLIMDLALSPTRSILDDSMAVVANASEMKCHTCEKVGMWKPFPVIERRTEQKREKKEKSGDL